MIHYHRMNADPIHIRLYEDQVYKFQLDCSQWSEHHGAITGTPTATVRSGSVTVGTPTESDNLITMSLTQTSEGTSRIELKFTDGTYTGVQNIFVKYIDRDATLNNDYGLVT